MPKLSEALVTLVEPYRAEAQSYSAYRALVAFGALAWNLSLSPLSDRATALEEALRKIGPSDPVSAREILGFLIPRKDRLFPDDRRLIAGCEVTITGTGFHVTVASTRLPG